ncbi:MAG TPA: sulfotransferase domain-containing protein [Acidimicrobiales bacterium]|nr:sulfotransferase domain-containing protein [Acidimicrobiales bacterium]
MEQRLPTFLLIGAMKAGTTSLYHYLAAHPQVATPRYKAPEFFVAEANWHRGVDWYRKQFPRTGPGILAVGEASNAYTKHPRYGGVPKRIASVLPDVRLIYVVRDPVARMRSHYQTRVAEGSETTPFAEAVFANHIYLDYSRYSLQIEQYLDHFPREQLLVITAEDLRGSRDATMHSVYEFVGVDPAAVPNNLDREFYKTKDRAARSPLPLWVRKGLKRRFPATRRFKELEPDLIGAFRRLARRGGQGPLPAERFAVPDDVRLRLTAELEDDVRRLRGYVGPDFDGWGIA